jgi:hypothetical protein
MGLSIVPEELGDTGFRVRYGADIRVKRAIKSAGNASVVDGYWPDCYEGSGSVASIANNCRRKVRCPARNRLGRNPK